MTTRTRDARMSLILTLLSQRGDLHVRFLPATLGVSGATVRRDVAVMEEKGLIRRSYGKIAASRREPVLPVSLRAAQNTEAKRRIGALASSLIPSRPVTLALGGGSTVGFVARSLAGRPDLTVVTNGLDTATALMARQVTKVVVTGGHASPLSHDLVGPAAEKSLRSQRFDYAVVGADGIGPAAGFTRHSTRGAEIGRIMLEQAERTIVVADSSKLGKVYQATLARANAVHTLVTDSHANAEMIAALGRLGVTTTVVTIPSAARSVRTGQGGAS
ncbi:DeoR/GlpR family DNA-binding transcription regulator [Streptomyces sp. NPDC047981]|uniref:DeoR/GlpR family DNA-binding transcription regulator n=1 Tax=Streptomyces sp. NPDC047981 TaxID=3154610 RepID=UPI0034351F27